MCFLEYDTRITGHCHADKVMWDLRDGGLDFNKLCGQAYDGTGNKTDLIWERAALITPHYSKVPSCHLSLLCISLS